MDEDNSDDELPSISLSQDTSVRSIVMPSAREVALQRAKELHTELELQRLREQHSPPPPSPQTGDASRAPPRSDSSGSEGEAALAAAVRALHVLPPPPPPAPHRPAARRLLALLPAPPNTLEHYFAAFADDVPACVLRKQVNQIVHSISCALSCSYNAWTEDEVVTTAGILLCACMCARPSAAPRRALHACLARAPHSSTAIRLAAITVQAATTPGLSASVESAPRTLLVVSDCLRGGGARAELLAALLVRRALTVLLAPHRQEEDIPEPLSVSEVEELLSGSGNSVGYRGLSPTDRLTALRLAGRALAGAGRRGAGGALAAIQTTQHSDKHHPDYLKVAVAASTLQLLFRDKQPT